MKEKYVFILKLRRKINFASEKKRKKEGMVLKASEVKSTNE